MGKEKRKSYKEEADDDDEDALFRDDEEQEEAPPTKRTKKEPKGRASTSNAEVDSSIQQNQDGEKYVSLGKNRRATVRKFNGKPLIDIREFYVDKEEQLKPGKKGISLTPEQWEALKQCLPAIDGALATL